MPSKLGTSGVLTSCVQFAICNLQFFDFFDFGLGSTPKMVMECRMGNHPSAHRCTPGRRGRGSVDDKNGKKKAVKMLG
jgi:hypothetical protein